jgi:hypothetical protein
VEDIQKALIQQNNIRWMNQKAMEGVNRPKLEPKLTIEYKGLPIELATTVPYFDTRMGRKSVKPIVMLGSVDDSGVFRELPPLLQSCLALINNHASTPSECCSCKYFSGDRSLKCAVNPTRKADQDCADFESASNVLGSDWKNGEAIEPMIYSELNQGLPIMMFDMHPTASPHCTPHIIGSILFAIVREHDSSEDNPANYTDWENSENNPANYSEY